MSSNEWQELLQRGIRAVREQRAADALDLLHKAHALHPASRDVCYWLANAQRMSGQASAAESSYRDLLQSNPSDLETGFALAFLLRENSRLTELSQLLLASSEKHKHDTVSLLKIAGFLRDSNQFSAAISVMQLALANEPGNAGHHFKLARLYQGMGQHSDALESYRSAISLDPGIGGAWLGLAQLQQFSDPENPDWKLISTSPAGQLNPETTMCIAFARGKGYSDLGQYEKAWHCFLEGNAIRHQAQAWSRKDWHRFVEQVVNKPAAHSTQDSRVLTSHGNPVYIVGMLRSGTTLLEQLLDQHPKITARGELNFLAHAWNSWNYDPSMRPAASEMAGLLCDHLRQDGPHENFYIDKNPLNFRYLSLVAELLPQARVLHLVRDGRDSCLSCFTQLFQHPDTAFANQLDDLVDYYRGYLRLMQHFEKTMPGQMLKLSYERLVRETPETLERIRQFLGLEGSRDFSTGMANLPASGPGSEQRPIRTASTWQARQAVHSRSIGRWKDYYQLAPGFFDQIETLDREYGSA